MRSLLLTALLSTAIPAAARVATLPAAPTTADAIDVVAHGPCGGDHPVLTGAGNVLKVHITPPYQSCDPPSMVPFVVRAGHLDIGEYRVEVMIGDADAVTESGTFIVRDGDSEHALFRVHPFAVPIATATRPPLTLTLESPGMDLCTDHCVWISVDGVDVPAHLGDSPERITFQAPPHAPGLVDVTVRTDAGVHTLRGALCYYDRDAEPNPSVFERVLFPVLYASNGSNGSRWIREAVIANPAAWFVETFNRIDSLQCVDVPCTERLAPGQNIRFQGEGYPRGVALLVPAGDVDGLALSLRVRDVSRQAQSFGADVPVVRERDLFTNGELTLLDVPVDPRYRTKLRLYAFASAGDGAFAFVSIVHEPGHGALQETLLVPMSRSCSGTGCSWTPFTGDVDVPPGDANERVRIYVSLGDAGTPAWAFASITNNETQQVTIVAPDGIGGRPKCSACEVP